jgi:hypothetical protein
MKTWLLVPLTALALSVASPAETPAQHFERLQTESMTRASQQYPDAVVDGSKLNSALKNEIANLEKSNPGYFQNAHWPEMLTAQLAGQLKIEPVATPTVSAPQPAQALEAPPLQHNDRVRMLYLLREEKMIGSIRRSDDTMTDEQIVKLYKKAVDQRALRGLTDAVNSLPIGPAPNYAPYNRR